MYSHVTDFRNQEKAEWVHALSTKQTILLYRYEKHGKYAMYDTWFFPHLSVHHCTRLLALLPSLWVVKTYAMPYISSAETFKYAWAILALSGYGDD